MKSALRLCWMGLVIVLGMDFGRAMGQEKVEPKRIGLWNGRASLGEGQVQETEVWITVYRPAMGNGTAVVICPGGGYGGHAIQPEGHGIARWLNGHGLSGYKGPMWDAWQEKSLAWLTELKLLPPR